jgi:hypothetical protein
MGGEVLNERALGSAYIQEEAAEQSLISESKRARTASQHDPASIQPSETQPQCSRKQTRPPFNAPQVSTRIEE